MVRLGTIFIAGCMGLIAASLGAASHFYLGLPLADSAGLATAILAALIACNLSSRPRGGLNVGSQIANLSQGSAELARQLAQLGRRLAAVESKLEALVHPDAGATDPIAAELGELGMLMKQLAETVAAHDALIHREPAAPVLPEPIPMALQPAASEADGKDVASPPGADAAGMLAVVHAAVADGRIDLYLQPIVRLPQRKVRYYEALSRLRLESGDVLAAGAFFEPAETGGLMPQIDGLALARSAQVVRRLLVKNREIGVFCHLAASTLADAGAFSQLVESAETNRDLAGALVFALTQRSLRGFGPIEQESLAALAERGFRFCLDQVTDLRFDPRQLAERGFRFVKVPAALLLSTLQEAAGDIHAADLSHLLGRYGIELIAEDIDSESCVVDLLDFDLHFGQGPLFAPPRPVRQEALRATEPEGVALQAVAGEERAARPEPAAPGTRPSSLGKLARSALGPA